MNKIKVILYFSLFTLLASCSDDLADIGNSPSDDRLYMRNYTPQQIQIQRLGYAYNAAGNVMDDASFSVKPVVNMDRLKAYENDYGMIVNSERRYYTSMDIFSGNTLQELGHEETKYTLNDGGQIGSGKYYKSNNKVYRGEWKNCYKAHMFVKHIMATTTIDVGLLRCLALDSLQSDRNVLEAEFRNDVSQLLQCGEDGIDSVRATQFSEKYGTHLVVSSNLGGMIELQMEINSDSCVNREYTTQEVLETVVGKQVSTTTNSRVIKEFSTMKVQYHGQVQVKGGRTEDCALLHRTFDQDQAKAVRIADGDYYGWATNISIDPNNYNAAFTGGRFLPLYELFEEVETRNVLRKVYEVYLKTQAPTQEVYEPPYGVLPVKGNHGQDVRVAYDGKNKACIICEEYVPSIRSDKPCLVAYPLLRGVDDKVRPFLFSGLFLGDESHRPGRVTWKGSASLYVPNDSIFYESDSVGIRNLFDPETHALKNVYLYWNNVHPLPCPTAKTEPVTYQTSVFHIQHPGLDEEPTVSKVASTFWSVRPIRLKRDSLQAFWDTDSDFVEFKTNRYSDNGGIVYKNGDYYFNLMDGGNLIKRAPEYTDDANAHKRWTHGVSMSMKGTGLKDILPTVEQAKSITRMLGNRMSIFYTHEYDGRNMLGLDWPTGYWVRSHPNQATKAIDFTQMDGQGMPIITNDAGQCRIMRLSGSGTDLLLEFPEYVGAFNYSAQVFFKFFPIYITIDNF